MLKTVAIAEVLNMNICVPASLLKGQSVRPSIQFSLRTDRWPYAIMIYEKIYTVYRIHSCVMIQGKCAGYVEILILRVHNALVRDYGGSITVARLR